eukprot:SAG31_NODE_3597_length_4085_cov_5.800301_2_plen_154_part_00
MKEMKEMKEMKAMRAMTCPFPSARNAWTGGQALAAIAVEDEMVERERGLFGVQQAIAISELRRSAKHGTRWAVRHATARRSALHPSSGQRDPAWHSACVDVDPVREKIGASWQREGVTLYARQSIDARLESTRCVDCTRAVNGNTLADFHCRI